MRKLTTDQFIEKAKLVHGDRYDYSKTVYVNAHAKIYIVCSTHGDFKQRPNDHKYGNGYPRCARKENSDKQRASREKFIIKAKRVHGDKYDYSLVDYRNNKCKINITCSTHGTFEQRPSDHLIGRGCQQCARDSQRMTTYDFTSKASVVHGDKYDYSESTYIDSVTKVKINCKLHGVFYQQPAEHLVGSGCGVCARNIKLTTSDFIRKSILTHGNKYDYSSVDYINSSNKVKIICREHGDFEQIANDHVLGKGCCACSKTGFDTKRIGTLYILRSDCGEYFKAGISNNVERRLVQLRRNTPFEFEPVAKITNNGNVVFKLEKTFHSSFESARMKGFDGCTEWFKWHSSVNEWISTLSI